MMIKVLASIMLVGAMLAGGTVTLPVLPEKMLVDNVTIHTFYDGGDNFAIVHNGAVNVMNGETGEATKTWPVEGSIYKIKPDYCIFYNTLTGSNRMYTALPSGNRLLSRNEQEGYLILDGDGSYARLPNRSIKEESNKLTVFPNGKTPYTIDTESIVYFSMSMVAKHNNYLYYLLGDKQDENVLWLVFHDFATGAEHFRIKSEPNVYKLSFSDDRVIFGQSVYNIPSKTKLFSVQEGLPEFFGKNYYTTAYDIKNIIFTLLDPSGKIVKSRKVDLMSSYRLTSFYGGFLVEYDKDKNVSLSDAFDETTPKIPLTIKNIKAYPLGTKTLILSGSQLLCFDYSTKKLAWKKDFQRIAYKNYWRIPTISETGEDGKEVLKAFDHKTEEFITLPEGYINTVKGDTVAWILPETTKPDQPWPLVYKDGKTTPATGETGNGTIPSVYVWKDTLVACVFVQKDGKTPFYEYVRVKDGQKTTLFKTTSGMNFNASFHKNHCIFASNSMIVDIDMETLERKETKLVKETGSSLYSYYPWQDGYLCRLKGSVGFVQNGKTVKTFKGNYVHHEGAYLWTNYNPGTTEVDDEGNTYTYNELTKYDSIGTKLDSVMFKNNQSSISRLDDDLYYLGNTIIDNKGGRIQTLFNLEKTTITSGFMRFLPDSLYTSNTDYASLSCNLIKWAPCATYTANLVNGKLVVRNISADPAKSISGRVSFMFIEDGNNALMTSFEGKAEKVENLLPGQEVSFDVGQIPEGKKMAFIAEINGVLDIGTDPSNDFKTNKDRYIGVPMSGKIGYARVIRILE